MHWIFTDISFIHVFKCFHFYVLPFFRKDNLFCLKNNDCLYKLYFYFILFFYFFFIFIFYFFYYFFLYFCYFFFFFNFFYFYLFFIYFIFFFYFFFFYFFLFLFIFFYVFYFFFTFLFFFILFFPYFRGNSLNSRADLEFKEIRLFSTMIFQKKNEIHCFFRKIIVEKEKTIRIV